MQSRSKILIIVLNEEIFFDDLGKEIKKKDFF